MDILKKLDGVRFTFLKIRFAGGPMGLIKKLVVKLFGKKLDQSLENHGLSKTKLAMVLAILIPAVEQLSRVLEHPIHIPPGVKDGLMALGLWGLRDGMDGK